jgi:hypothetical protein
MEIRMRTTYARKFLFMTASPSKPHYYSIDEGRVSYQIRTGTPGAFEAAVL